MKVGSEMWFQSLERGAEHGEFVVRACFRPLPRPFSLLGSGTIYGHFWVHVERNKPVFNTNARLVTVLCLGWRAVRAGFGAGLGYFFLSSTAASTPLTAGYRYFAISGHFLTVRCMLGDMRL